MSEKMPTQGAKPKGLLGRFIGNLMNFAHTGRYRKYFKNYDFPANIQILDIGCGGGKFVKYLSEKITSGKIYGLDHSSEMVELSEKVNHNSINSGNVKIVLGGVEALPFSDMEIGLVTAFETIQFWPNLPKSLSEVFRIMKPDGHFIIMNQYPKPGTKWFDRVQLKNDQEYKKLLTSAGFKTVETDLASKPGWIIVKAEKD